MGTVDCIRADLLRMRDEPYRAFQSALMPGVPQEQVIGIRIPVLRRYAKALARDALKKFNRENGVTVVMISSELEELRTTCDRIAIVSGGRIVGILPATESSETFGALMVSQVK